MQMTPHENIEMYWAGARPEPIPFSIYGAFCGRLGNNPEWVALFERGLVLAVIGPPPLQSILAYTV